MMENENLVWLTNRYPLFVLSMLLPGLLMFLLVYPFVFPNASLCFVVIAFTLAFFLVLARFSMYFVYKVGISEEKVVFKKTLRKLEILRSEVVAVDISPPFSTSDLERPWYKNRNRHLSITLLGEKRLTFELIELSILSKIQEVLQPSIQ